MFSPIVVLPLMCDPGRPGNSNASYRAPSLVAWTSNCLASSGVHQSVRTPSPSLLRPWSSNPCVISCPITAPIPP